MQQQLVYSNIAASGRVGQLQRPTTDSDAAVLIHSIGQLDVLAQHSDTHVGDSALDIVTE